MKTDKVASGHGINLAKRLGAYSAAATAVTGQGTANAAEVVWDIPDVTVGTTQNVNFFMDAGTVSVTSNVQFSFTTLGRVRLLGATSGLGATTYPGPWIYVRDATSGVVGSLSYTAIRLGGEVSVKPTDNFVRWSGSYDSASLYSNWAVGDRGYVGIKFNLADGTHYGWADITRGAGGATLHAFGYNDTPDTPSVTPFIPRDFALRITPNPSNPGHYDFEWDSLDDKIYALVAATDLSTPPADWPVWNGHAGIPSEGTTTTLTKVPGGGDPNRLFAVVENKPPLVNGSFEKPGTTGQILPADDWDVYNPGGLPIGAEDVATYEPGDAPLGTWVGSVYAPAGASSDYGFSQVLGTTFAADTNYVVGMQLRDGSLSGASLAPYKIQLVSGSTVLAEDDNSLALTTVWAPRTLLYEGTQVSGPVPAPGDPLELRILIKAGATINHAVDCDDVTFSATSP